MKLSILKCLLLLGLLTFFSCGSEEDDSPEGMDLEEDRKAGDDKCLEIIYPIAYNMPDGSVIEVDGEEKDVDAIKQWYEDHPDVAAKPELQYPIELIFKGEEMEANSDDEFERFKKACDDWEIDKDVDKEDCFQILLPVSYTMPDGSSITINVEDDYKTMKEWYEDHPDMQAEAELEFPVVILFEEESFTVNSNEEFERYKDACDKDRDIEREDCLKFIYPISFTMPDGSTITINEDEGRGAIEEWYENHPDAAAEPEMQFPVNIIFDDEEYTVNNAEEMQRFRDACEDRDVDRDRDCYEYIFPISFELPDGAIITIEAEDGFEALEKWYEDNPTSDQRPQIQFPFEIKFGDQILDITNQDELDRIHKDCEERAGHDYDCPELETNIGEACRLDDGTIGEVNEACECEV